jgi:hypothetical protein
VISCRHCLANEEHVDAPVHELFEETGLILTVDDLILLRGVVVRVSLFEEPSRVRVLGFRFCSVRDC